MLFRDLASRVVEAAREAYMPLETPDLESHLEMQTSRHLDAVEGQEHDHDTETLTER